MSDKDDLLFRGIPFFSLVDEQGVSTDGTGAALSTIRSRGMEPICQVDSSGVATSGSTLTQMRSRAIRVYCAVTENGVTSDAVSLTTLRSRGIYYLCPVDANGIAVGGTATMAQLAAKGITGACFLNSSGSIINPGSPYTLVASLGTFTLNGQSANLLASHSLTAALGTFVLSGQDAALVGPGTRILAAGTGTFILTGDPMTPLVDYKLPAAVGSFVETGVAANLVRNYIMPAALGTFTFTGIAATLTYTPVSGSTTLNPSDKAAAVALSGGNLIMTNSGAGMARTVTSYSTGKKYFECVLGANFNSYGHAVGVANSSAVLTAGPGSPDTNSVAFYNGDPAIYAAGSSAGSTGLTAVAPGDRIGVAVDLGNSTIWVRINNGNWNNSGANDPATNTGGISISAVSKPWFAMGYGENTSVNTFNFGGSAYTDTPPSGFGNW